MADADANHSPPKAKRKLTKSKKRGHQRQKESPHWAKTETTGTLVDPLGASFVRVVSR
jgi:hypothetical protein